MAENTLYLVRYGVTVMQREENGFAGFGCKNSLYAFDTEEAAVAHGDLLQKQPDLCMRGHGWLIAKDITEGHKQIVSPNAKQLAQFRDNVEKRTSFYTQIIPIEKRDLPYYQELHKRQFNALEYQRTINGLQYQINNLQRYLMYAGAVCVLLLLIGFTL